jgi:hypothetical protein
MRATIIATLLALAFGLTGVSVAQAAPGNGLAIGKAAIGLQPAEKIQWRRRRRRCWHGWRSRRRCD